MKIFISGFRNEATEEMVRIIEELGNEAMTPYFSKEGSEEENDFSKIILEEEVASCGAAIFDLGSKFSIRDHVFAATHGMICISLGKEGKVNIPEHSSVRHFSQILYYSEINELRGIVKQFVNELSKSSKERL